MFKDHPKGLVAAALSNMGERFGYYIMNAVLLLFLSSKFGISDEISGWIYAVFYFLIYVLSLPGGIIADRTQNYKGTIISGLIVMAIGYGLLSIPILSTSTNIGWLLPFTCVTLFIIAAGNGLFKGNLQAIVGQMYDNFEAEAAKKGEAALKIAKDKRDAGFQIFYVFINIGGLIAPFIAPTLRSWWLGRNGFTYNADLPALCHKYIGKAAEMTPIDMSNLNELATKVQINPQPIAADQMADFCQSYLEVFNTGVHYSFVASVVAMLLSLTIFLLTKKSLPNPAKKDKKLVVEYTPEEKQAQATEIKQRLYALFAVLGVAAFFWFSFHQNGQSLSVFARDFVKTTSVAPEIWQAINPGFVILLTPLIMWFFGRLAKRGKEISTPRKIAIGMFIAATAYIFLAIVAVSFNYPSAKEFVSWDVNIRDAMKASPWVLIITYFFLTTAELFISPLGLSFVSKIAPKHLQGICQGLWLTATAIGNLFIALGVTMLNRFPQQWMTWAVFAGFCLLSMGVMLYMIKWLEKVTK
ncbi:MAG: peptide MFS transporter [Bacteroidales bacterium]|uniref:peptide MFS transporter n=1 Tax=Porphyromonas sp. TaxID=1924944 RepID=UPI0029737C24|nr:peptide MFS transporter [Porphyromonas sp.]MDD7437775.1 peptide MFS transporter [Bacteroidales bacterium]MDY3067282.1 peptide MFS transporter [Porphyromonas sp.]